MFSFSCLIATYYLLENLPTFQNSYNLTEIAWLIHINICISRIPHLTTQRIMLSVFGVGLRLSQIFHRMIPNRHISLAQSSLERLPSAVDRANADTNLC